MSNEKMKDPYSEYEACLSAEKSIIKKIEILSESDVEGAATAVQQLGIGLIQVQDIKEDARKQYNERCELIGGILTKIRSSLEPAEQLDLFAQIFEEVLQLAPIGENDEQTN